jgi:hypothetical protein
VFFKNEERTFYEYCFAKADRDNISKKELRRLKKKAKINFTFTDVQISEHLRKRTLIEVL